jgi:hypothetical protein
VLPIKAFYIVVIMGVPKVGGGLRNVLLCPVSFFGLQRGNNFDRYTWGNREKERQDDVVDVVMTVS